MLSFQHQCGHEAQAHAKHSNNFAARSTQLQMSVPKQLLTAGMQRRPKTMQSAPVASCAQALKYGEMRKSFRRPQRPGFHFRHCLPGPRNCFEANVLTCEGNQGMTDELQVVALRQGQAYTSLW